MKVAVLTGKRGGYDAMRPMLLAMRNDPFFELDLIACDMHFREEHGLTINEITKDFEPTRLRPESLLIDRSRYISRLASQLAYHFMHKRPDLLVLFGDRGESLAAAMIAVQMSIPIAHIQGGDTSGTTDDIMRDMITKSANLHFVSCYYSGEKVHSMKESDQRIFRVGDLHLDRLRNLKRATRSDHVIVLLHPDISDKSITPSEAIRRVLLGCAEENTIVIYPCNDPGGQQIIDYIKNYPEMHMEIHKNLSGDKFANLLATAKCIVGNSSAGIIEAPFLDTPVINMGKRQHGRTNGNHPLITNVDYNSEAIQKAINKPATYIYTPSNVYGNGTGGTQIIKILKHYKTQALLKPKMGGY